MLFMLMPVSTAAVIANGGIALDEYPTTPDRLKADRQPAAESGLRFRSWSALEARDVVPRPVIKRGGRGCMVPG
ncbi:MAG: hypothetical protein P8166_14675 [Candidatus Thiodiazotropha sp.]